MLFNTLEFLVFFVVVTGLCAVLRHRHRQQNRVLLVASYIFYGAWDYRFLALIGFTTLVDWTIARHISATPDPARRKRLLIASIICNLGVLGTFKYFNFFTDSFIELAGVFGFNVSPVMLKIILPVGISFYTFQSMSYTIDVYRGRLQPCARLQDYALYVAFFPQLVAGPIERATHLLPQVLQPRTMTAEKIGSGLFLILVGLFKKVVMADNLAPAVDAIFSGEGSYSAGVVLAGMLLFAFQIYGDFSGYTDIARGTARILGFDLMLNFREPYFARSPSDFWTRWHVSLSAWLRDYLYIPLGGNRHGRFNTYRNLLLTMLLGGLWHGAAWNFVLWGLYHGLLLVGYRVYEERTGRTVGSEDSRWPAVAVQTAVMFGFTLYGWLLFRATSGAQIVEMTAALGTWSGGSVLLTELSRVVFYAWPVVLLDFLKFRANDSELVISRAPLALQALACSALFFLFVVFGSYEGASFIYFQF